MIKHILKIIWNQRRSNGLDICRTAGRSQYPVGNDGFAAGR